MLSWGINNDDPWILMGDFNSTLYLEDMIIDIQIANSNQDEFCLVLLCWEYRMLFQRAVILHGLMELTGLNLQSPP